MIYLVVTWMVSTVNSAAVVKEIPSMTACLALKVQMEKQATWLKVNCVEVPK